MNELPEEILKFCVYRSKEIVCLRKPKFKSIISIVCARFGCGLYMDVATSTIFLLSVKRN